jgi:hypothetical protein
MADDNRRNPTAANKVHNQWRGSVLICSLVFQNTFGSWDSDTFRIPATAYAQTLAVMITAEINMKL